MPLRWGVRVSGPAGGAVARRSSLSPAAAPLGALLAADAHHQGDLNFEGKVRVEGRFTGRLYGEDALEVGPRGEIEGEVDVASAILAGRLKGHLRVRGLLVLEETAEVEAVLDIGLLEVHPGARLRGEIRVRGAEWSG